LKGFEEFKGSIASRSRVQLLRVQGFNCFAFKVQLLRVQGSNACGVLASFLAVTVQGFNACGVQLPAAFNCLWRSIAFGVQLPAAFNCLRCSITCGVPASFLAVTFQYLVRCKKSFSCHKGTKSLSITKPIIRIVSYL
jgi:hypothetical protein